MSAPPPAGEGEAPAVRAAFERCRDSLLSHPRAAFDELAGRLGLDEDGGVAYFLAGHALPVVQLPRWCAALAERTGRELAPGAVDTLCAAAVAGYLHVRAQDDLLDEGLGRPAEVMLLAEALLVSHLELLDDVAGRDSGFRRRVTERWRRYGEAMLLEARVHGGSTPCDEAVFLRLLERSRPLVLPGAAALVAAGLDDALDGLEAYVGALVEGHQRFHDLRDAERDLRGGRHTLVTHRHGGGDGASLRRQLVLEGGFDRIVAEARVAYDAAGEAAAALGLDEAVADAGRRIASMEEVQRSLFERVLHALLEK